MNVTSFPHVDEFFAVINALNKVLVARNTSHNRGHTVAGSLIMASLFFVCLLMGLLGLGVCRYPESREQQFRRRTLAYFKSFSLPSLATLGAHKALEQNLGFFAAVSIGLIATTAGGVLIDLFPGVTAGMVPPYEHIVTTAVLASSVCTLIALFHKGDGFFSITLTAVGPGAQSEFLLKKTA